MNKARIIILIFILGIILIAFVFWFNTQPVWPVSKELSSEELEALPLTNKDVLNFIHQEGPSLAPTYESVVCTEFVIKVIDEFSPLTKIEKNDIRILTDSELDILVEADSPVIKGVQTALIKSKKGLEIKNAESVLPGDFVQFWNVFQGKAHGHCGVVLDIEPDKTLTLYSSHPSTNGYGTQKYLWPEKVYFVRLK